MIMFISTMSIIDKLRGQSYTSEQSLVDHACDRMVTRLLQVGMDVRRNLFTRGTKYFRVSKIWNWWHGD